jgi:hypothetical protein
MMFRLADELSGAAGMVTTMTARIFVGQARAPAHLLLGREMCCYANASALAGYLHVLVAGNMVGSRIR